MAALALTIVLAATALRAQGPPVPPDFRPLADDARARLCALYSVPTEACAAPISLRFAASPDAVPPEWAGLPSYAAGAADPQAGRIIVVLSRCGSYPFGDAGQTLRHELSHVLLARGLGFAAPRWLDEGLAMRTAAEWGFSDEWYSALALPAVAHGSWHLDRVDADFAGGEGQVRRSYALAKGFVRDLFKSDADLAEFIREARRDGSVDRAFQVRFGMSPDWAFSHWAKNLPWWGEWVVALSNPNILWLGVVVLFLLAAAAGWRRRRRKYEALDD